MKHAAWIAILLAVPVFAQLDLTGIWSPVFHEDQPERIPGPELADFLGLPINDAARQWALAWDPSRLTAPEHQCQVHTVAYMYRGPLLLRIWEERDPQTQDLIALRQYISNYEQDRTIYMDGRPHPPAFAPHTWMGFSTGKWEGNILTVTTTHIKQGWHRRNGVPSSDRITLVEHFIRHDDHLTHVTVVTDPDYLTEPLIKSQDFTLNVSEAGIGTGGITTGGCIPASTSRSFPGVPGMKCRATCRARIRLSRSSPSGTRCRWPRRWAERRRCIRNIERSCSRNGGLLADHMRHRSLVPFVADVLNQFGIQRDLQIALPRPRLGVGLGIVDRELHFQVAVVWTTDSLDRPRFARERIALEVQPQSVLVTACFDHQFVALPMTHRVALEIGKRILGQRAPVEKDLAILRHILAEDDYGIVGLEYLLRKEIGPLAHGRDGQAARGRVALPDLSQILFHLRCGPGLIRKRHSGPLLPFFEPVAVPSMTPTGAPKGMSEQPNICAVSERSHGVLIEFQMPDRSGFLPTLGMGAVKSALPSRVRGTRLVFTSGH